MLRCRGTTPSFLLRVWCATHHFRFAVTYSGGLPRVLFVPHAACVAAPQCTRRSHLVCFFAPFLQDEPTSSRSPGPLPPRLEGPLLEHAREMTRLLVGTLGRDEGLALAASVLRRSSRSVPLYLTADDTSTSPPRKRGRRSLLSELDEDAIVASTTAAPTAYVREVSVCCRWSGVIVCARETSEREVPQLRR